MNTRILVIGGTGNISRWFIPILLSKGYDITVLNRGSRNEMFDQSVRTIICDRTNHTRFEKRMLEEDVFDVVIDMVVYEPEDAHSAVRAFRGRVGQYIFCSTVDVFDKFQYHYPVRESSARKTAKSFQYADKKLQCEHIFEEANDKQAFPLTILRPAATYSEGWSPLITCFGGQSYHLDRMIKSREMILHGDGSAIWVATHSLDVASAFANAVGNPRALNQAINVMGDDLMTWKAMHFIVAEVLGVDKPDLVYIPTMDLARLAPLQAEWCVENFQFNNIFDNSLAKEILSFRQTISFRQGATKCIEHLQRHGTIELFTDYPFYEEVLLKWKSVKP